ncbi:MAG TPA: hypothetical protein VMS22_25065 [Candidatus Eisenbacteria bacterium]|nr:hypothetical protein [Candidatus Eisenbacteria bacterium]
MTTPRWLPLLLLATLVATSAPAETLCRSKRGGGVNVRSACRKHETVLSLTALGVTDTPGPNGSQGPAGPTPVHLVDATGLEVGPVLNAAGTSSNNQVMAAVLFTHSSLPGPVLLAVTGDGRIGGNVYHESTDCSGPGYVDSGGWLPILTGVQSTIYIPGAAAPAPIHVRSYEVSDPQNGITPCPVRTASGSCCNTYDHTINVLTTTTTSYMALGLTPPFRALTR